MMRVSHYSLALLAQLLAATAARAAPDRVDVSRLSEAGVRAQQEQLRAAGCYKGDVDGRASEDLRKAIDVCPDLRPVLRIETGMHVAATTRIGVDRACRIAATASDDKTVRVWSLPDARLVRTLRWPVGSGNLGKVYAVAVSPDGRYVAAGGWDPAREVGQRHALSIFDAATGALVKRVGAFESVVNHLAFSRDGRYLAATLGRDQGVRMIDAQEWRVIAEDRDYGDRSYGASFGPDGRLYTVAYDGKIRRYGPGPGFKRQAMVQTRGGKQPFSISVDPRGERLAVGFFDTIAIDLYEASNLRYRGAADTRTVTNGDLFAVQWRADGAALIAGGRYDFEGKTPFLLFDRDGKPLPTPAALADNTIISFQACGEGFAVAASGPAFGLLDRDGGRLMWKAGVAPDMRDKLGANFSVSADGGQVRFGLGLGGADPVLFDLARATLTESPSASAGLRAPRIEGLPVKAWEDEVKPTFSGKPISLDQYETSRSLAIRPDGAGFALGTEFSLRSFDKDGKQAWRQAGPGVVWGVNIPESNKVVVAAYGDGTIRWHELAGGKELLALFVQRETKQWVAWTPSGYYTASPGGEDLIGWHVNRGWDQAADFFPASRFRDTYYRPDIVQRMLETLDEGKAVELANAARPAPAPAAVAITERLPPVVSILSPIDGATMPGSEAKIAYIVRSPSGLDVDAVDVLVDGRPSGLASALAKDHPVRKCLLETKGQGRVSGALQGCRGEMVVGLPPGEATISLIARAGERAGEPEAIRLTRTAPATAAESRKGKLFALVVGISQYSARDLRLQFADRDAEQFAKALENQRGTGLYSDVQIRPLVNKDASSSAIKDGLQWLLDNVGERDVGVVFLSGHGMIDDRRRFYFLGAGSDPARLRSTAVPRDEFIDVARNLRGRVVMFIDACHAGSVSGGKQDVIDMNQVLIDFKNDRGVLIYAASTGSQTSVEKPDWQSGAFTLAVTEALGRPGERARAARTGDAITTSMIDAYVTDRVKNLTDGQQTPLMIRTVSDFQLGIAN